jgi:putative alpha-1,2-mannosidase
MKVRRSLFRIPLLAALVGTARLVHAGDSNSSAMLSLSDYIRPMVGTKGEEGNPYPGASARFGMIQISPDTDTTNWDTDSGYAYEDPTILDFSLTHLTGTGCPDLGDFVFMPQVEIQDFISGTKDHPDGGYQSPYSHNEELASAGYYRVKLQKSGVLAEMAACFRKPELLANNAKYLHRYG